MKGYDVGLRQTPSLLPFQCFQWGLKYGWILSSQEKESMSTSYQLFLVICGFDCSCKNLEVDIFCS